MTASSSVILSSSLNYGLSINDPFSQKIESFGSPHSSAKVVKTELQPRIMPQAQSSKTNLNEVAAVYGQEAVIYGQNKDVALEIIADIDEALKDGNDAAVVAHIAQLESLQITSTFSNQKHAHNVSEPLNEEEVSSKQEQIAIHSESSSTREPSKVELDSARRKENAKAAAQVIYQNLEQHIDEKIHAETNNNAHAAAQLEEQIREDLTDLLLVGNAERIVVPQSYEFHRILYGKQYIELAKTIECSSHPDKKEILRHLQILNLTQSKLEDLPRDVAHKLATLLGVEIQSDEDIYKFLLLLKKLIENPISRPRDVEHRAKAYHTSYGEYAPVATYITRNWSLFKDLDDERYLKLLEALYAMNQLKCEPKHLPNSLRKEIESYEESRKRIEQTLNTLQTTVSNSEQAGAYDSQQDSGIDELAERFKNLISRT